MRATTLSNSRNTPLDVGCFSPLRTAYGRQVEKLIRNRFNHITKLEFLPAFRDAFNASITEILFNLDKVISKLDVRLRTPTPPTNQEKQRKRKRIQKEGVLSFSTGQDKSTEDPTTASSSSKKGHSTIESSSDKNGTVTNNTVK
ncbi:hypothetical protein K469DRAFT_721192 [Zopfia rhizophila CBS 207.26]|uniref:Uncharacterized protein n=1 Tax=Zopfia rhizophila CBS 207.26 TaxID=1314779 RepID=A0A6A6DFC4_9PEZI|nr:hypothetical protein K469DRAFT_721192 [Zopfia rhizophila CBS 207.26]